MNHPVKRKSLWKEAILHKSDIICAQETHFSKDSPPQCSHRNFPKVFTANANTKTKGVLTAIRDTVTFSLHTELADPGGRYLILVCDINSVTYTIVNVYAPNAHQMCFFKKLMRKVQPIKRVSLYCAGTLTLCLM